MLSDEEKKAIEVLNHFNPVDCGREDTQAIETILNLIEKQSKEIEELKEEREKYPIAMNDEQYKKVIELAQKDIKEELDRQINVRMINKEYIEKNYISKDKIKAKIEEYDDKGITVNLANRSAGKTFQQAVHYEVKKVLQSLLEKE